jgi:hypothetical protein
MSFLKDTWNNFKLTGIPISLIVYVIIGYFFIWLSHENNGGAKIMLEFMNFNIDDVSVKMVKDSLKILGTTFIVSGVATTLLRTNFFTNILQKQLFKVVYTDELLKSRRDIIDIWSRVSKILYSNKFPDIADSINDTITRRYFPIEKHYYYHKNENSLKIEVVDAKSRHVRTIQTTSGVIKLHRNFTSQWNPYDSRNKITLKGGLDIFTPEEENIVSVSISKGAFNGQPLDGEFKTSKEPGRFKYECIFDLRNVPGDTIEFEYTIEKNYCLCEGIDRINVLANNIHFDSTLYINYDPNALNVCFIDIGTADTFKDTNKNCPPGQINKKYEGVIFPGQGYGVALQIRNP